MQSHLRPGARSAPHPIQQPSTEEGNILSHSNRHWVERRSEKNWLRTFLGNLGLGSQLAFVAGIVNSVAFLAFGAYVSHVSGLATRSAVEYSEGNTGIAAAFCGEIFFFVSGAILTTVLQAGRNSESRKIRYFLPVFLEAALITGSAIIIALSPDAMNALGTYHPIAVFGLCMAMGMQNAILRHASGAILRTTHVTGMVTDMGIALGTALHSVLFNVQQQRKLGAFKNMKYLEMISQQLAVFGDKFKAERFFLHFSLFSSFLIGAAAGAMGFYKFKVLILAVPIIMLLVIGIRQYLFWDARKEG